MNLHLPYIILTFIDPTFLDLLSPTFLNLLSPIHLSLSPIKLYLSLTYEKQDVRQAYHRDFNCSLFLIYFFFSMFFL